MSMTLSLIHIFVAHRAFLFDDDARRVEVTGDGDGVGIDDLPDQDFVADRKDGGFHCICCSGATVRPSGRDAGRAAV